MSLSVNPYSSTYSYSIGSWEKTTAANKQADSGQSGKVTVSTGDSLELSPEYLAYLTNLQNQAAADSTYSAATGQNTDPLTTDEKKSILAELQSKLSSYSFGSAASGEEAADPLGELLSTLQEKLSEFDAESASEEEIDALFDDIAETVAELRPPRPEQAPPGNGEERPPAPPSEAEGIPPFLWDLLTEYSEGTLKDGSGETSETA
ncbi:hypothetical protein EHV15_27575 [Paenibacillus oralis]|uniref:Uncharacterized protein n=1 Tax=Paenibacillus oralis TaxID=2490856 RepID=A0A3P3U9F5_9BACL|nr:hypothetical protein [Paenibacillus oralis]RRJ66258.1 hypothetical protein EHV15_27575 [Paenibacillus oralis]